MILLTGATGTVGSALLRRLTASGEPVRCLVRDPRRLGDQRVRVQIALGDLANPASFRHALRGVDTVVHLAAAIRDQPRTSIEDVNAVGTLRLVRAAERAGTRRFVFFSALAARHHSRTRFFRAKALARTAVEGSGIEQTTVFSPSIVYAPGDPWLTLLERFSWLPAVPVSGSGRASFQPIWAEDVADCIVAALAGNAAARRSFDLAGPQTLSYDDIVHVALRPTGRRRPLAHLPLPLVRASLNGLGRVVGPKVFATWDEAELMEEPMTTARGTADAEALGVRPLSMAAVLGTS